MNNNCIEYMKSRGCLMRPGHLVEILDMLDTKKITRPQAKEILNGV